MQNIIITNNYKLQITNVYKVKNRDSVTIYITEVNTYYLPISKFISSL